MMSRKVVHKLHVLLLMVAVFGVGMIGTGCSGDSLSDEEAECASLNCGAGNCAVENGQAVCICPSGFVPYENACVEDPCIPDPCVYGDCRISGTRVYCQCNEGYRGELCDQCADGYTAINGRCIPGDPCDENPCVFGVCSVVNGDIACICHANYAGDLCDECAEGFIPQNLRCVSETNPCEPNPCAHGTCRVEDGQALCSCETGYDGAWCDACAPGYEPDGVNCIPQVGDPCDPNPCDEPNRSQCVDVSGQAVCSCDPGYELVEDVCLVVSDPCEPNPCVEANRGVCVSEEGVYQCLCDDGFREDDTGACVEDTTTIPTRICGVTVRYRSSSAGPIFVRGDFNNWGLNDQMERNGDIWELQIDSVPAGNYAYKLYDQSTSSWFLDPNNPFTKFVDGAQNSRLRIPDCDAPLLELDSSPIVTEGRIRFSVATYYGRNKTELDAASAKVFRNGAEIANTFDPVTGVFTIDDTGLENGKYSYLIEIQDRNGKKARPVFVPVWVEAERFDWRDGVMYFVLTDRFNNGDHSNDDPVSDGQLDFKANWQGGDFAGITRKLEDGYFDDLGVNVLWISSPIMNTQGAFWGSDSHKYTGYHSYWPISTGWTDSNPIEGVQPTDPHFGSLDELKELVATAHARGIRIVVDFVANHVHSDSPVYQQHIYESDPWFHWDGSAGNGYVCGWDRPIECWFAEYLPDFEYKNLSVTRMVMDHAIWLIQETGIDGFRLDAVKHMILDFSYTIRGRIDEEIDTYDDIRFYMVGETFTGEGDGERQTIKKYVGKDLLDGQFDFPFFWAVMKGFLRQEMGLDGLKGFVDDNDGYYGVDAIMSTFLGNHDVSRALSHAAGDIADMWGNGAKEQGWTNPPGQPNWEDPYKKLRQAWTFLYTQPMIPLIYYGDEFGMPGAGDPDNRRFMRFPGELTSYEDDTLTHCQKLGAVRSRHPALRTGQRQTLKVEAAYWAYVMKKGDDKVLVVFNRGNARTETLNVGSAGISAGTLTDAISGQSISVSGGNVTISLGKLESAVFEMQ